MLGSIPAGIFRSASTTSSHCNEVRFIKLVREALLTSVACSRPAVIRYSSQVSMVPKIASANKKRKSTKNIIGNNERY